jgi:hypothetical protein
MQIEIGKDEQRGGEDDKDLKMELENKGIL